MAYKLNWQGPLENPTARVRRLRARARERGMCGCCRCRPKTATSNYCIVCRAAFARRNKERKRRRSRCRSCGRRQRSRRGKPCEACQVRYRHRNDRRRVLGLCINCPAPALLNQTRCAIHADIARHIALDHYYGRLTARAPAAPSRDPDR